MVFTMLAFVRIVSDTSFDVSPRRWTRPLDLDGGDGVVSDVDHAGGGTGAGPCGTR
jgi:hypothetical protein